MQRPLAITAGEPAGIGPDLCIQIAQHDLPCEVVVVGSEAERLGVEEIRERIVAVQTQYGFDFGLPELASREASGAPYRQSAPLLRDAYTPMGEMPPRRR